MVSCTTGRLQLGSGAGECANRGAASGTNGRHYERRRPHYPHGVGGSLCDCTQAQRPIFPRSWATSPISGVRPRRLRHPGMMEIKILGRYRDQTGTASPTDAGRRPPIAPPSFRRKVSSDRKCLLRRRRKSPESRQSISGRGALLAPDVVQPQPTPPRPSQQGLLSGRCHQCTQVCLLILRPFCGRKKWAGIKNLPIIDRDGNTFIGI